jgi:hypothetical protein
VGLCADGTVIAVGNNGLGQCNVSDWRDIGRADPYKMRELKEEEQRNPPISQREAENQQISQRAKWIEQGLCPHCGGRFVNAGFFGLLGKKCESCGRPV